MKFIANHLLKGLYLQPLERLLFLIFYPLTLNRSNMENYKHYSTFKKTLKEILDSHDNWCSNEGSFAVL